MTVWFEGTAEIECSIERVKRSIEDPGTHFVGIVTLMPGLTSVELLEQGIGSVTIKTNEGIMTRSNISPHLEDDRVVEFDERYEAGSKVTATAHFFEEFTSSNSGVTYRLAISDVAAPGLLGFFYRKFGSSRTGKAFLAAHKEYLEQ